MQRIQACLYCISFLIDYTLWVKEKPIVGYVYADQDYAYFDRDGMVVKKDPEYIEDDSLAPGEEEYDSYGKEGCRVVTDIVTYKDGEEISREFLHNSIYRAQAPVIRRNSG